MIEGGADIIYVDETTFNTHLRSARTYLYPQHPVNIEVSNNRLHGVTLFGAIGSSLSKPVFMTAVSTNKDAFFEFMKLVVQNLLPGRSKPYLVHDGHRSHYAVISRELIEANFTRLPMPSYSCQFNSIEMLWANIKVRFKWQMAQQARKIT